MEKLSILLGKSVQKVTRLRGNGGSAADSEHIVGELMPLDYARPQLEEYILTTRQVEFLRNERGRMYDEAIQQGKIVFYEN